MEFAEWLLKECKECAEAKRRGKPVTYYAIAHATGLDQAHLWRIANKEVLEPSWTYMEKIAKYFGTPLWVVVKEIEEGLV